MSVTRNDLIALGLPEGADLAPALAEANRLQLAGAALQTFVRVFTGASDAQTVKGAGPSRPVGG